MKLFTLPGGTMPCPLVASDGFFYLTYQANVGGLVVFRWPVNAPDVTSAPIFTDPSANQGAFALLTEVNAQVLVGYRAPLGVPFGIKIQNLTTGAHDVGSPECFGNSPFVWSYAGDYGVQRWDNYAIYEGRYPNGMTRAFVQYGAPTGLSRYAENLQPPYVTVDADNRDFGPTLGGYPVWANDGASVGQYKDGGVLVTLPNGEQGTIGFGTYTGNPRIAIVSPGNYAITWWVAGRQWPTSVVVAWGVTAADLQPLPVGPPPSDPGTPIDPPVDPGKPEDPIVVVPDPVLPDPVVHPEENPVPETTQQTHERLAVRIYGMSTFDRFPEEQRFDECVKAVRTIMDTLGRVPSEPEAVKATPIYAKTFSGNPQLEAWAATRNAA